jgi:hypothetical protein
MKAILSSISTSACDKIDKPEFHRPFLLNLEGVGVSSWPTILPSLIPLASLTGAR